MTDLYTVTNISGIELANFEGHDFDLKYSESVPFIRPKIVPLDYSLGLVAYMPDSLSSPSQMLSGVGMSLLVDRGGSPIQLVNALYESTYSVQDDSILSVDNGGKLTPLAVGETDIVLISGIGVESKRANLNVRVVDFIYPVNGDAGGGWGRDIVLTPYRNFTSGVSVAADPHFTISIATSPDLLIHLHPVQKGTATLTMTDGSIVGRTWSHSLYFYTLAGKYNISMTVGSTQTVEVDGISTAQAANLRWELVETANESPTAIASLNITSGKTVIVTANSVGQFRIRAYMDADRFYISKAITIA